MAIPVSRTLFGIIPLYSLLIVIGAALAIWLASREEKRAGLPKETVLDLSFWVIPFGIIGARIYYVAFAWDQFKDNPVSALYVWEGGIAIYGAVIAGFIVLLIFCRMRKISAPALCDVIAPGLVLAQAIGRWGNYFNMEAYGEVITDPALQFFPFGVLITESGAPVWHMATFFYESFWDFLVFLVLIIGRRKWFRKEGDVFGFYCFLYSAGRLIVEDFRMDSLYAAPSLRISQLLALILCTVWWLITLREAGRRNTLPLWLRVLFTVLHSAYALVIALYCFRLPALAVLPLSGRALLLSGYSLTAIVTLCLLYGRSDPGEVRYAIHTA